tara:strand:+ start:131 stop:778 length:648 start_codon:yes stop_codon:yes gene_type:complete
MTKIIVALDSSDYEKSIGIANVIKNEVDGFKINHLLWEQTEILKSFADELFLDCKLWDTPNTVKEVVKKIVNKGATMTTICTHNNTAVFQELEEYADKIKLLGVTYLTSWSSWEMLSITNQNAKILWRSAIDKTKPHGFSGIICSPSDLETVNPLADNLLKICPGIGKNKGQVRTTTPLQAKEMGADYIVIGRTITESEDPLNTIKEIKESLLKT